MYFLYDFYLVLCLYLQNLDPMCEYDELPPFYPRVPTNYLGPRCVLKLGVPSALLVYSNHDIPALEALNRYRLACDTLEV